MSPKLDRRLGLEAQSRLPDGAGGMVIAWEGLGEHWAEVEAGSGRDTSGEMAPLAAQSMRITVRAAPESALSRPRVGQRFIEGTRRYRVLGVAPSGGAGGLYLVCQCLEEAAP